MLQIHANVDMEEAIKKVLHSGREEDSFDQKRQKK